MNQRPYESGEIYNMKKFSLIASLFALLVATTGCGYSVKDTMYRPAVPAETRGANYQPAGKVKEKITYYRDFDVVFGVWHTSYYLMDGAAKMPMGDDMDFKYNRVYTTDSYDYEILPPPYEFITRKVLNDSGADIVMNARFEDSCEADWYFVLVWWMNDRKCDLTLTGTLGKLR